MWRSAPKFPISIGGGRGVHQDEEELGLAGQVTTHRCPTASFSGAGRKAAEGHLQIEALTGQYLAPETRPLDATEERELARESIVGQNGDAAQLGQRFDHEDTGESGTSGKVAGKESFVAGQLPLSGGRLTRLHREDVGDEEEGGAMGQVVLGSHG
jgi:hypothetical protein